VRNVRKRICPVLGPQDTPQYTVCISCLCVSGSSQRFHSTKAKPYVCGIGTCTKAFSDPSSCTRHRKETHRREGAYKCIVPECGTRSVVTHHPLIPSGSFSIRIKRRSAFVAHMKKHDIDVRALDMDAIVSSANKSNAQESFHFLPPYIPDTPYCPLSKTGMAPAVGKSRSRATSRRC
jgi:hypothetical protein